jgi:hypothetical protein
MPLDVTNRADNGSERLAPSGVFPVIFDPPLKDTSPQPGPFARKTDSSPGQRLGYQLPVECREWARDAVLANEQVRHLLQHKRYAVVGMDLLNVPSNDKITHTLSRLIIYNYTDDLALDVRVDLHNLQIISVAQLRYQPPLSFKELDHAIQLAKEDDRMSGWLTAELRATGILVTQPENNQDRQHREVLVLFASPNERSSQYWALVDLSNDTSRKVGQVAETDEDQDS